MNPFKKWQIALASAVLVSAVTVGSVSAQAPQGAEDQVGRPPGGAGNALVCSTTNYTDVAAKALGISSIDLRVALVGGKTISTIAASKNVTVQTVTDALNTARKADVAQAVKDGLLTQAQADALINRMDAAVKTPDANATPSASATAQANPGGRGGFPGLFGRGFEVRVPAYNVVNRETVVATALGMSCPDLVKAMQSGQTLTQIAASKNVQLQTVIDALINAYKTAYTQDVKEGLITQAEADGRIARLTEMVMQMINNPRPQGPRGPGGRGPGKGGQKTPDAPNAQPTAAATKTA